MSEKQIDLDAMRALARDLDTFALSIARRGQIQAALLEMSAEIEQLRKEHWTCFFCGQVFTTQRDARFHFGVGAGAKPVCVTRQEEHEQLEHQSAIALEALRKERDALREALNDCEAKASLGAKMINREHPTIADGFIIIATRAHNALAAQGDKSHDR